MAKVVKCSSQLIFLACLLALTASSAAHAAIVEHIFHVGNLTVSRLCTSRIITAVNGQFPGPTIRAREGDTVVVTVVNESPYNISIHWHGIFQMLTAWADGPSYVTQCPIRPGNQYTYKFTITGQEGTLWWHAHFSMLRATVYGALIIKPGDGKDYPFPKPDKEIPIVLGEWWDANVVDVQTEALAIGAPPNISNAFTINGRPGDLYPCSKKRMYKLHVEYGKTYMLRIINAAVDSQLFFKIAGHCFTVVAADAVYTTPYSTDIIVVAPGQTVDALMLANASPGKYYIAASPYISTISAIPIASPNTTTTGVLIYDPSPPSPTPPLMPAMPASNDTPTAHRFYSSLTSLELPGTPTVPMDVDEQLFVTIGFGVVPCGANQPRCDRTRGALTTTMNNVSFQAPTQMSLLEAHFRDANGVYTADFPEQPPVFYNFTDLRQSLNPALLTTVRGTRAKKLKFNASVEVVLQNTAVVGIENHPVHLHGFNFFIVAQGFGNFDPSAAATSFNLVNPQFRNTIAVPAGGWAVIRFVANNPGVWIMHCHLDMHLSTGLATAFEVDNGGTPSTTLPPPPPDFPTC